MMRGTIKSGRSGKRTSGRRNGFLPRRVNRNISKGAGFTPLETITTNWKSQRFLKGFTLIELLVVIAIIALLMAIIFPVLRSARNRARAVICQANLKQWGQILNLYTQDNEGFLPRYAVDVLLASFHRPYKTDYDRETSSYAGISAKGITCCPMATAGPGETARKGSFTTGEIRYGNVFEAWEITGWDPPFRSSYGFNDHFFRSVWIPFHNFGGNRGFNTFLVTGRTNIPAFLDATIVCSAPKSNDDPPPLEHDYRDTSGYGMQHFCINRHNGYINGMFLDWSVRKIGLKELWVLKWNPQFDTSDEWTKAGGVQPEDWPKWMQKFKDY